MHRFTYVELIAIMYISLFTGCAPLIMSGGSTSVVSVPSKTTSTNAVTEASMPKVTVLAQGGQVIDAAHEAAVNAQAKSENSPPPSRWRYLIYGMLAILGLAAMGVFVLTRYRIGLVS